MDFASEVSYKRWITARLDCNLDPRKRQSAVLTLRARTRSALLTAIGGTVLGVTAWIRPMSTAGTTGASRGATESGTVRFFVNAAMGNVLPVAQHRLEAQFWVYSKRSGGTRRGAHVARHGHGYAHSHSCWFQRRGAPRTFVGRGGASPGKERV